MLNPVITALEVTEVLPSYGVVPCVHTCVIGPSPGGEDLPTAAAADSYDVYFNVEFDSVPHRITRLANATLKLFKKLRPSGQYSRLIGTRVLMSTRLIGTITVSTITDGVCSEFNRAVHRRNYQSSIHADREVRIYSGKFTKTVFGYQSSNTSFTWEFIPGVSRSVIDAIIFKKKKTIFKKTVKST